MTLRVDDGFRNREAVEFKTTFDAGTLTIYSGTQPADPNSAPSGTVLAVINLPGTAFTVSGPTASKTNTWQDSSANAGGEAGWARLEGAGPSNVDFRVTGPGGGGEFEIDDTTIVAGGTVTVTSGSVTFPSS